MCCLQHIFLQKTWNTPENGVGCQFFLSLVWTLVLCVVFRVQSAMYLMLHTTHHNIKHHMLIIMYHG